VALSRKAAEKSHLCARNRAMAKPLGKGGVNELNCPLIRALALAQDVDADHFYAE
jgi:hypothetical protein